jgi:putative aldouronate transport system permease protein
MFGVTIAFQDYNPFQGFGKNWVGLKHFKLFFDSIFFFPLLRNTFVLSITNMAFTFPMPIIFALLQYEVRPKGLRTSVQSISYFPHFISVVIVCGLIRTFAAQSNGLFNAIIVMFGGDRINFMQDPRWFLPLYVGSGVWQTMGWSSIIYYATLTSIDTTLFEAADIDGASRLQKIWHISLPSLKPTITVLLLLNLGNMMNIGFEKVLLLHSPATYEVSDIISTYVFRTGLVSQQYSFAAAVGLFNSLIGITLIITFNAISKRITQTSLW